MQQEERIRERAHRIWEAEGRPMGRDHEHWQRACREIEEEGKTSHAATRGGSPRSSAGPAGDQPGGRQAASASGSGLAGADDPGTGTPDAMGVDDLGVAGRLSDPSDSRPTTGRSKLAGS